MPEWAYHLELGDLFDRYRETGEFEPFRDEVVARLRAAPFYADTDVVLRHLVTALAEAANDEQFTSEWHYLALWGSQDEHRVLLCTYHARRCPPLPISPVPVKPTEQEEKPMTRIVVALDVTVSREAWISTYGSNPADELPEYVAERAAAARRLRELTGDDAGARYRLVGTEVRTDPTVHARGFITMRVVLDITVNAEAWASRYGLPADVGIGPHIAAEVASASPMLTEIAGTVELVSYTGARVIKEETITRKGRH
jgi:hypothetical protein